MAWRQAKPKPQPPSSLAKVGTCRSTKAQHRPDVSHAHMSDGIWFASFDLDRGLQLAVAVAASSARGNMGPAWRLATHPKLAGRRHACRDSRLPPLMDCQLPLRTRIVDGSLGLIAPSTAHIQSARPAHSQDPNPWLPTAAATPVCKWHGRTRTHTPIASERSDQSIIVEARTMPFVCVAACQRAAAAAPLSRLGRLKSIKSRRPPKQPHLDRFYAEINIPKPTN